MAIQDYQKAKSDLQGLEETEENQIRINECNDIIGDVTEFLQSNYCKLLSNIDGKKVLAHIDNIKLPTNPVEIEALVWTAPKRIAGGAA